MQNMEYKFVELLSAKFFAAAEDVVRQQVSYRYNLVKARLTLMAARLADVNALVSSAGLCVPDGHHQTCVCMQVLVGMHTPVNATSQSEIMDYRLTHI